jgi:TonB dependent receptor
VLNLSMLSPGVSNASALAAGSGPSVGGMRPRDNNFTVEGVDNNRKDITGPLITVPNDAVANFTVLENQFNTEFGHSSGGQFNTTVKSGTNSFHGSLYEYFENRNLNALDNYYVLQGLKKNPPLDNNRYGGTFGGPIVKKKLFFFTNFERQRFAFASTSGGAVDTPTAAGLAAIGTDPNLSSTNFGIFKKYVPLAAAGSGCIPYNGQSNGTKVSSFSAPANGSCAAGNIETGAVSIVAPGYQNYENLVGSVDYNISDHDQIRGRYIYNKEDLLDTTAPLSAFYAVKQVRWHLLTLSEYHTFTPTVLNEFRGSFNRFVNPTPAGNFAYAGLNQFPNITLQDLGSGLNVGPNSNAPQTYAQNFYSGVDNVSWTRGAHSLKFGAEFGWYISPQTFTQRQRGDYQYNETQLYLEDFSPDLFGERSSGATTFYGNDKHIYWYGQDTWRVNPRLSLDYGIRYEYTTLSQGEARQTLNQLSNDPNLIVPAVNQPLLFNKPQVPNNDWAPRFGFAYSPGNSGTTSIRGGIGMAYDILYDNIGILAPPPQIGATFDVNTAAAPTTGFLGAGGLPGGGSGISSYSQAVARSLTSAWIPNQLKWPYAINWNFGIQHSFGQDFIAEVRYVGTHGVRLDQQDRINKQALVTPTNFLPTYLQAPTQAQLDALTTTLTGIQASGSATVPAYKNDGFTGTITSDLPIGSSIYHGLQSQLTRRFSNGLTFQAAYTYSRDIDSGTADFFSTYLTPRRPQDFQNWKAERGLSALSRTHRFTVAAVYDLPYFKGGNWLMRNVVGNWGFSPVYTYESPEYVTVNAGQDANLNGDSAGDRGIFNPAGTPGIGTDVKALHNSGGATVAYLANNGSAQYIRTGPGALSNLGRNTLATVPTNNLDFAIYKDLNITERMKFHIGAQAGNLLNHPQYIPGSNPGQGLGVNDVLGFNTITSNYLSYVTPGNASFNLPKSTFGSSSRQLSLVAKFIF